MSVRLSNQGDKTIERARNPLRFTFNQSSDTNTHTPSDGQSFFPFYVISSGLFLIGAMDGWMKEEKNHFYTHARSDTITPTAFVGVSVILSFLSLSVSLTHTLPA